MNGWKTDVGLLRQIKAESPRLFVAFSCGKDSIASLLHILDSGVYTMDEMRLYYMYLVPGLEFIEEGLKYFEDYFKCKIERIPHPSLLRMLKNMVFCAPQQWEIIQSFALRNRGYADFVDALRCRDKAYRNAFVASGVRACDSPLRRIAIKKYGPINRTEKKFFPIWDKNIAFVRDIMSRHGAKLPVDYEMFGRSFDGIDYRFLAPIKQRFPKDYERIEALFPMAGAELFRYEEIGREK